MDNTTLKDKNIPRILISAPYMIRERKKIEQMLKPYNFIVDWADVHERLNEDELLSFIDKYDGVICGDDRFTSKVYDAAKNLRVIVKWGTGIDSLNMQEASDRGIKLFRTPGAFTDPVADSTLGYMLAYVRNIFLNDQILKLGGWDKPQGYSLAEKTIGIIGFGSIGQAVAKRLLGFNCEVLANDTDEKPTDIVKQLNVQMTELDPLLRRSDIITLHCDLNPTSEKIINHDRFSIMKRRPYIINTARGPLINENDLVSALEAEMIAGAALDVFEKEPLPLDSPLRINSKVLLASHNSNSSPKCWDSVHENSLRMLEQGLNQ